MNYAAPTPFALVIALAGVLAACAATPDADDTAPVVCGDIAARIARSEADRQQALSRQQGAWKAVVPFAVGARYVSGRSGLADADRRLAALRATYDEHGCASRAAD